MLSIWVRRDRPASPACAVLHGIDNGPEAGAQQRATVQNPDFCCLPTSAPPHGGAQRASSDAFDDIIRTGPGVRTRRVLRSTRTDWMVQTPETR